MANTPLPWKHKAVVPMDSETGIYLDKARVILGNLLAQTQSENPYVQSAQHLALARLTQEISGNPDEYSMHKLGSSSEYGNAKVGTADMEALLAGKKVPSVPEIVVKLQQAVAAPNASAESVARVVDLDPAISASMLRLVNSASFALSSPVTSIARAVSILGIRKAYALAVSGCIVHRFAGAGGQAMLRHWEHSIACAIVTKDLATICRLRDPEILYLGGLLHDIGRLVLLAASPTHCMATEALANRERITISQAEHKLLGFDHAELGREFLARWGLHAHILAMVAEHHAARPSMQACAIVQVADFLSRLFIVQRDNLAPLENVPDISWRGAGIQVQAIEQVFANLDANIRRSVSVLVGS